jgi:hypothetical protein
VAEDRSDKENVWACLKELAEAEKASAVQYPMLLGYLRGRGIQPWGMSPILDSLESDGLISKKDSQGNRWMGWGDAAGPLWIHLLRPADATRMLLRATGTAVNQREQEETRIRRSTEISL